MAPFKLRGVPSTCSTRLITMAVEAMAPLKLPDGPVDGFAVPVTMAVEAMAPLKPDDANRAGADRGAPWP